jgi:hypothetical protein
VPPNIADLGSWDLIVAIDVDEPATALHDAMPRPSEVVDRYHRFGESELAIPAALAGFAQDNVPLPAAPLDSFPVSIQLVGWWQTSRLG